MTGVREILQHPTGLTDPNNYHEFCRLLARLKSNYQLGELVMVDHYSESIQVIHVEILRIYLVIKLKPTTKCICDTKY